MSKLPIIKARDILKVLKILSFTLKHKKGSHFFFSHKDDRTTVIPIHPSETLGKGVLRSILRDIEISVEELNNLLKK